MQPGDSNLILIKGRLYTLALWLSNFVCGSTSIFRLYRSADVMVSLLPMPEGCHQSYQVRTA